MKVDKAAAKVARAAHTAMISDILSRIESQPIAATGEYLCTPKQAQSTRSRLYSINKNSVAYRYRTFYEHGVLCVWRFRK